MLPVLSQTAFSYKLRQYLSYTLCSPHMLMIHQTCHVGPTTLPYTITNFSNFPHTTYSITHKTNSYLQKCFYTQI
jgi:hypothetical protein